MTSARSLLLLLLLLLRVVVVVLCIGNDRGIGLMTNRRRSYGG